MIYPYAKFYCYTFYAKIYCICPPPKLYHVKKRVVWGGGGLSHESRKINEVFHVSRKFFEGLYVSGRINAGWNDYRALGMICNDQRSLPHPAGDLGMLLASQWVQGSTLVGIQGAKPPETSEVWLNRNLSHDRR